MDLNKKRVWYAEDDQSHRLLFEMAIDSNAIDVDLKIHSDGKELFSAVHNCKKKNYYQLPDLIITDIIMPYKSGFDIIRLLKEDPVFMHVPIIIFSSSNSQDDISRSLRLGANAYILKQFELDVLNNQMKTTLDFWLKVSSTPGSPVNQR